MGREVLRRRVERDFVGLKVVLAVGRASGEGDGDGKGVLILVNGRTGLEVGDD